MAGLFALAQHIVEYYKVKLIVIMQGLHCVQPRRPVKYPVDVVWFSKCYRLIIALVQNERHIFCLKA